MQTGARSSPYSTVHTVNSLWQSPTRDSLPCTRYIERMVDHRVATVGPRCRRMQMQMQTILEAKATCSLPVSIVVYCTLSGSSAAGRVSALHLVQGPERLQAHAHWLKPDRHARRPAPLHPRPANHSLQMPCEYRTLCPGARLGASTKCYPAVSPFLHLACGSTPRHRCRGGFTRNAASPAHNPPASLLPPRFHTLNAP